MNGYRNYSIGALSALLILMMGFAQYAGAFGWVLNGTVLNAATCAPLAGVNVSANYNCAGPGYTGCFYNISNAAGHYNLPLGVGNWSVSYTKAGFQSGYYYTPYESSGAYFKNVSLIPVGGVAGNCGKSVTVVNATKSTITPGASTVNTTTIATTSAALPPSSSGGLSTTAIAGIVIVVIVVIIVIAWAAKMRGGGKKKGQAVG